MDEPDNIQERFSNEPEFATPANTDAERVIIAACMTSEASLLQAIELLEPDYFFSTSYQNIFKAMISLFEIDAEINVLSIAEELKIAGVMHTVGGVGDISEITVGVPYIDSIESYTELVIGKYRMRQLVKVTQQIVAEVNAQEDYPDEILSHAETKIYQLTETRHKTQLISIDQTIDEVIYNAHSNVGLSVTGLRSGIIALDNVTTGFHKADLILLAARPSIGKTSEAVSIIVNTAVNYENTVAFFTMEMSRSAIIARMICNLARVSFQSFRQGLMNHQEWDAIDEAKNRLSCNRIFLDDKPAITILEARAKLRRLEKFLGKPPDLVVFDYLQLMTGLKEHRKESRQQEVAGISAGLKTLAKEFDIPIMALSQLKRIDGRSEKRPQLHDLRESGAQEQDADLVIFIDRYEQDEQTHYEQIIAKNRNGPTDVFGLAFNGPAMRFDNLAD